MADTQELRVEIQGTGSVSAVVVRPEKAKWMLALGHGAGAGMHHPFMTALATELARVGIATLRYQFPYMEERRRAPDKPKVLMATVSTAAQAAAKTAPDLPLLAGGKSMGGRMSSQAAAEGLLPGVRGLVFFGFPLHPPKQPGTKRAEHLEKVSVPMLFLQGTRDDLADLKLLMPICKGLGNRATLHVIESADHSFHVLKKSGRSDEEVLRGLAETTAEWAKGLD
ncbi:MAG TPA: alpha/beta family hydrolase [Candidatus Eremiobacteraceae bacterium]|nr:alpha/beta family hydrolase [Candidatus Eremiobacteraceae bacterium]